MILCQEKTSFMGKKKLSGFVLKMFPIFFLAFNFIAIEAVSQQRGSVLSFEIVREQEVFFNFNAIQKYQAGITVSNAMILRIDADVSWDLYVYAKTQDEGLWDQQLIYAQYGDLPEIEIMELRFRNTFNTSNISGFFPLQGESSPIYIIGSPGLDAIIECDNAGNSQGANAPGNHLVNPECYQFNVDVRIVPGFSLRPGLYTLHIEYVIVENL